MKQTVRFIISTATVYIFAIGAIGYAVYPAPILNAFNPPQIIRSASPIPPTTPSFHLLSGKPIRITIPDYAIDLPVGEGYFNESDSSWTLNDTDAFYAMMTSPANNYSGNTLVYGHGTDAVFGKLGAKTPPVGTIAEIYTDNNHVFRYTFMDVRNLTPNDTSVLLEAPTPTTLTVQTCTGIFSEWRSMFRFQFQETVQ